MKTKILLIISLLINYFGISQNEVDYSSVVNNFKNEIEKAISDGSVKGMAFALIDGNRIVCAENFGYSDFENKVKADSNTIYGIGSVTKLFTATAILQLYEKRMLDIDSPILQYCPEFKIKKRFNTALEITPRMLICHYSGLPSDVANGLFSKKPKPFNSIIEMVEKEYAPYPPNYIYAYSNVGYSLLGVIIENMTDEKYEDYIQSNIFKPLKMYSARFKNDYSSKFSKGYDENGNLRDEYAIRPVPAGAIKSNIKDMAKFAMSFLPEYNGTKILNMPTINSMFAIQNNNIPLDLNEKHGMPWFFEKINSAGQLFYHTGGTLNHRTLLAIAPESNLAVVILSNSVNTGRFHSLSINLLDSCALLKGKKPYVKNQLAKSVTDTSILDEKDLEKLSGLYANPEFVFELIAKNNQLQTKVQDNEYVLIPLEDGSFMPKIIIPGGLHALNNVRFEFLKIENKDFIIYHSLSNDKRQILGTKFYHQEIDSLWMSRIGTYEIVEPNESDFRLLSSIELVIENGVLVLNQMEEYEGSARWNTAISIKDDNIAFPLGLGRHRGSTLLFESENGKEILWFSGYKLKKVED